MGRLNGAVSQRADSYSFYVDWSESEPDIANNCRTVYATAYIYCSAHTAYASGQNQKLIIDGTEFTDSISIDLSAGVTVKLISGSKTVYHNSDGTKSINISAECNLPDGDGWGPAWGSLNQDVALTTIPRYANFTEHYVSSTGLNSITVRWNADSSVDWVQYSLNGGAWTNTSGLNYTINGLSPNTQYNIRTRIKRTDSQLWTESGYIYGTTKDIARIISASDFNLGDNPKINISNPSGEYIDYYVEMLNPVKNLLTRRAVAGENIIEFTQEELDTIYKKMGNANSTGIRFGVMTKNSHWDWNDRICTLTGNQKTGHTNVNGVYKRTKGWINVMGAWKRKVRWVNVNGTWKRCI